MLHRRKASTTTPPGITSPASPVASTQNASYVPTRARPPTLGHARGYNGSVASNNNGPFGGYGGGSYSGGSYGGGSYGGGGGGSGLGFEEDAASPARSLQDLAVRAGRQVQAGVRDAVRLDRSWGLVWGDVELRSLVIKLTLLNLLSLTLLSLFPLVLSPVIHGYGNENTNRASQVSFWYNVLLSWPTFAVIFWVNSLWGPDVARRAQMLLHPAYRHQSSSTSAGPSAAPSFVDDPGAWAWMTFTRLLLIVDFTFVFRVAVLIPVLGWPVGLGYMALINSYYAFEWIFVSRGWGLDYRCTYIADRTAFMFGFGLPATVLTTFGPPIVNMAVFTLIYPFLILQALQSRPPTSAASILPSTPSTPSSPGPGGDMPTMGSPRPRSATGWMRYARVPVFFFARNMLNGSKFLADAVMRERGGFAARKRSKRAN